MTKTRTCFLVLCLISCVFSRISVTHPLSFYTNNAKIDVADGSKVYLASTDKAVQLSKITLTTNGSSITLNKLLNNFDSNGFTNGWPVNTSLTISTLNSVNVTRNLHGQLFIATPTMAKDPNFSVYVVRGTKIIDRSQQTNTTIVLLAVHNKQAEQNPTYAGLKYSRIESIVQPKATSIFFYRYLPDDNYADVMNSNTLDQNIFSNPLRHALAGNPQIAFFENIDPLQFTEHVWFRGIGGFKFQVSDNYVDTTTIQAGAVTVTGMTNSQAFTYNSSVNFVSAGNNRVGNSGYVISTVLFATANLTIQLNGQSSLTSVFQTSGTPNIDDDFHEVTWPAVSLQVSPNSVIAGLYYIQYFNIDGGPVTTTAAPTNTQASSSASPASMASSQATSQSVETTTKSSVTSLFVLSFITTLLHSVLYV